MISRSDERELDRLYAELASLRLRFAEADDAERQGLEDPICRLEMDIEDIEADMALAEENELRSDYRRSVL